MACTRKMRKAYRILVGKTEDERQFERTRSRCRLWIGFNCLSIRINGDEL
jgi:hypothetical protein